MLQICFVSRMTGLSLMPRLSHMRAVGVCPKFGNNSLCLPTVTVLDLDGEYQKMLEDLPYVLNL